MSGGSEDKPHGWPIQRTWNQYEAIAMHFNDLLIRLRVQALGGVAALSTLVGIFTKTETARIQGSWDIAAGVFFILAMFWLAIWILDLCYYNRLLVGSVATLFELEELSKTQRLVKELNLSSMIALAVAGKLPNARAPLERFRILSGVWIFYSLVFAALLIGFGFCLLKYLSGVPTVDLEESIILPTFFNNPAACVSSAEAALDAMLKCGF